MIANISIQDKSFGDKMLYQDLSFTLNDSEKVGLIGRNGTGKTTLFGMLGGQDTDFAGEITLKSNLTVVSSRQEHDGFENTSVIEYILSDLPKYRDLKHVIDTYPATMGDNIAKITTYSEALEQFGSLDYYRIEEDIEQNLLVYGLNQQHIHSTIGKLSGGQKRLVELVKLQLAKADLILIDEPTNHMDYAAKQLFINWLNSEKAAVLVITHDRDVLRAVDKILELRDGSAISFKGNYDAYLRNNTHKITSEVNEYQVNERRIVNLKQDVVRFQRLKEKARNPGTIKRFKSQEQRARAELTKLQAADKPSFWIDRESVQGLNNKLADAYEEHKAKNIIIRARTAQTKSNRLLVEAHELSLSYNNEPLFNPISFQLREGERLRLHGRNGAGKTTIVKAILATAHGATLGSSIASGHLACDKGLTVGNYEQEVEGKLLKITLAAAVEQIYTAKDVKISDQKIKQLLSDYLFIPATDGNMLVQNLSGGQKARLQLMGMLANDPMLLILDEPTNHLDLPSIEELEQALAQYHGAILYISHDTYFTNNLGGEVIAIDKYY